MNESAGTVRKNSLYPLIRDAINDGVREELRNLGGLGFELDWKSGWESDNVIRAHLRDGPPGSTIASLSGGTRGALRDILTRLRDAIRHGIDSSGDTLVRDLDYETIVNWDEHCVDVKINFTSSAPGYPTVVDNSGEPLTEAQRIGLEARRRLAESAGGFDQSTRYSGVRDFCDGLIPYVNGNLNGIEIVRNDEDELQSTRNMDFVSIDVRRTGGSKIFDAIICDGGSFGGHVADLAPYMEFDEDNFDYKVNFKSAAYTLEEWIEMVAENMDGLNESLAGGQGSPTAFMAGQKVGAMHGEYVRSALRCLPYNSRKHTFMDCETDLGGEEYVVVDEDDIVIANSSRLDDCNAFVRGVRAAQKAAESDTPSPRVSASWRI